MAIQEMEKVYILGYEKLKLEILGALQKLGVVEVTNLKQSLEKSALANYIRRAPEIPTTEYDQKLATLQYGIDYLLPYQPRTGFVFGLIKSLLESIIGAKFAVSKKEFEEIGKRLDKLLELCNKLKNFESELSVLRSEESKILTLKEQLKVWKDLRITLGEVGESKNTFSCLCSVASLKFESLGREIKELPAWAKVVNIVSVNHYLFVIVSRNYKEKLEKLFRKYEAHIQIFPEELKGTPKDILKELDSKLRKMDFHRTKTQKELPKLAKYRYELLIAYDYLLAEKTKYSTLSSLGRTQNTFLLEGWIKKSKTSRLKEALAKYKNAEIITRAPLESEVPPVTLEERKVFRPFQLVTNLYGKPAYTEIDPTPFLAPFFLLFFALCLTDAGYGLVLIALSLFLMKKVRAGRGFFMLMLGCGAVTVVIGFLTGSFFGNLIGLKAIWMNPIAEPADTITFLLFTLMLGVIQTIYFGPLAKLYHNIKLKKFKDALFDQVFWVIFLSSILFILLNHLGFFGVALRKVFGITEIFGLNLKALGAALQPYMLYVAITTGIVVVATKGRHHKKIGKRLATGLASLYGVSGYIGDILSYSRLLALGMTTSAIALVVNTIAFMFIGTPYVGILLAVIILIFGHAFNLIINCLTAFVHTARLQFVEFFSKFIGGTGKGFTPFSESKRYSEVR